MLGEIRIRGAPTEVISSLSVMPECLSIALCTCTITKLMPSLLYCQLLLLPSFWPCHCCRVSQNTSKEIVPRSPGIQLQLGGSMLSNLSVGTLPSMAGTFAFFLSCASSILFTQGTVSLTITTCFVDLDHSTMSNLSGVLIIISGNMRQ